MGSTLTKFLLTLFTAFVAIFIVANIPAIRKIFNL